MTITNKKPIKGRPMKEHTPSVSIRLPKGSASLGGTEDYDTLTLTLPAKLVDMKEIVFTLNSLALTKPQIDHLMHVINRYMVINYLSDSIK